MSFSFSPKIVTDGLFLCLDAGNIKSYVSGSTIWNDLSKSGLSGSLLNGPIYNSSTGGSISFDGINDYVLTNYSTNHTYFSFECVFKLNIVPNAVKVIVGKYNGAGNDYWFGTLTDNSLVFSANGTALNSNIISNSSSFYIATCVMGTSTKDIYINGTLKNSASSYTTNPNGRIALGAFGEAASFNSPISIYSFKFYNRELTANEVLQNYNATKSRFAI